MKIYIAGKITGLEILAARAMFDKAQKLIELSGHDAINPMEKVSEQLNLTWAEYMKEDIPLLLSCEGIFLLENWGESKGARLEQHIAEELGMKVMYENDAASCRWLL